MGSIAEPLATITLEVWTMPLKSFDPYPVVTGNYYWGQGEHQAAYDTVLNSPSMPEFRRAPKPERYLQRVQGLFNAGSGVRHTFPGSRIKGKLAPTPRGGRRLEGPGDPGS